jgi:hypothetical protein
MSEEKLEDKIQSNNVLRRGRKRGGGVFLDENVSIKTQSTVFRYSFKT